jgi:uncharacterized protein YecT (DUF1311 family)
MTTASYNMKRLSNFFLVGTFWVSTIAVSTAQKRPDFQGCIDAAKNQGGLNDCGKQETDAGDRALNKTYRSIIKKYADQPLFVERLRVAQRAWLKFRDAQIAMRFPVAQQQDPKRDYGSVYPMCYGMYKAELTRQRTKELSLWLSGIEEGDVCSGSIKRPEGIGLR